MRIYSFARDSLLHPSVVRAPVEYFTPNEGLLSLDFTIYGVHSE
jgi:hypothetical protein